MYFVFTDVARKVLLTSVIIVYSKTNPAKHAEGEARFLQMRQDQSVITT